MDRLHPALIRQFSNHSRRTGWCFVLLSSKKQRNKAESDSGRVSKSLRYSVRHALQGVEVQDNDVTSNIRACNFSNAAEKRVSPPHRATFNSERTISKIGVTENDS